MRAGNESPPETPDATQATGPTPADGVPHATGTTAKPSTSLTRKIAVRSGIGFLAATGVGMAGIGGLFVYHGQNLPDVSSLKDYRPQLVSRIADSRGHRVEDFWETDREYVTYDKLPPRLVEAFVAAEDGRFFEHDGIDFVATARAVATSAFALISGDRLVGGSTITQQLAKNMFLSRDRRLRRKVREIILARRIDATLSKKKILEIYLNEIYLGRQAYGVAAAARAYFGKRLDQLTLSETAFLAGLPKAPSLYDPTVNRTASERRRDYVVGRMLDDGRITAAEAKRARAVRLVARGGPTRRRDDARYFADAVKRELLGRVGADRFRAGGYRVASTIDLRLQKIARKTLRDGLLAYDRRHGWRGPLTTLPADALTRWQEALRALPAPAGQGDWKRAVVLSVAPGQANIGLEGGTLGAIPLAQLQWARPQNKIERPGKPTYAAASGPRIVRASDVLKKGDVVLVEGLPKSNSPKSRRSDGEPAEYALRQIPEATGALVAMDPHTGRVLAMTGGYSFALQQYGAASRAERQPGSAFKPFVYLAALEANLSPATVVYDEPFEVALADGTVYRPRNYSGQYMGAITLRRALELSRNSVAVRLASHVGLPTVAALGKRFGVADSLPAYYSMALGSLETTPLRLARAYAILANGGKPVRATLFDSIVDRDGKTIYRHSVPACPDCGVFRKGRKISAPIKGTATPVADPRSIFQVVSMMRGVVQQGTGSVVGRLGLPIAGKTGTTNDNRDAWFVGFTTDLVVAVWVGFEDNRSLGPKEQGGVTAAPIFRDFMAAALNGTKVAEFVPPKGIVRATVVVLTKDEYGDEISRTVYEVLKRGNVKRLLALASKADPDARKAAEDDARSRRELRASRNIKLASDTGERSAKRKPKPGWMNSSSSGGRFADHNAFR